MAHQTFTSGTGKFHVYFEIGRLQDGTKQCFILRRPTLKAAKIEALNQARLRELPHVHVYQGDLLKWCTCSVTTEVERCMGA